MHRKTNAADGGSGFVIASDAVMHHAKVDGKRIARPPWCQRVFLGNCCGNSLYHGHLRCVLDCDDGKKRDERRNEDGNVALDEITFRFYPRIERIRMKKLLCHCRYFYAPVMHISYAQRANDLWEYCFISLIDTWGILLSENRKLRIYYVIQVYDIIPYRGAILN